MMVFGAVLMATMVFFPHGIVPTLARVLRSAPRPRGHAMTLLAVEDLGKSFGGVHAIEDLSFALRARRGAFDHRPQRRRQDHACSTCSPGIYVPDRGRILLDGRDLTGAPPHRWAAAGIGRTFQNLQVFFNMTALENVMTGRHLRERDALCVHAAAHAGAGARRGGHAREWRCDCWRSVGLGRAGPTHPPTRCLTARSSGSRSHARWPPSPSCCCSTSRPRA